MRTNQNKLGRWALHPILFVLFATGLTAIAMQDGQSRGQDEDAAPDWLKYCVSCPQHDIINDMAGVWTTTVRSWADPSSEPIVNGAAAASIEKSPSGSIRPLSVSSTPNTSARASISKLSLRLQVTVEGARISTRGSSVPATSAESEKSNSPSLKKIVPERPTRRSPS